MSEVWTLYNTATAVVLDLSMQTKQARGSAHEMLTCSREVVDPESEHAVADIRGMRVFKFALTLTLIMNGVLSTHYPHSESLAGFRNRFANEAISKKAEHLMPMGTGFMGIFFDHVWAIEDQTDGVSAAWDIYGTEAASRGSTTFSKRLEDTLESLL